MTLVLNPGGAFAIALIVIYFLLLIFGVVELYIFVAKTTEGTRLTYRVMFYFFLIVLCVLRITQMLCTLLIVRADVFVRVDMSFQTFGDIAFFAMFVSITLAFIQALKLQYHVVGRVGRVFSMGIFITMCIVQLALFITFQTEIQGSIDYLVQTQNETFLPANYSNDNSLTPTRDVNIENALLETRELPNTIYRSSVAVHAGFTILFGLVFFGITLMVYFTLKGGDQFKDPAAISGKLTMTYRVLLLNGVVTFFLISRVAYISYHASLSTFTVTDWFYGVEFVISEVLPILTFLLFLYSSKAHMASSFQNSQSEKSHNSLHVSTTQMVQILTPEDAAGLNATQWLTVLSPEKDKNRQ